MKPTDTKFFGNHPTSIKIRYNDGSSVKDGFIVRQSSWCRYEVSDGNTVAFVALAQDQASVDSLPSGYGVIKAIGQGGTKYVKRILGDVAFTVDGVKLPGVLPYAGRSSAYLLETTASGGGQSAAQSLDFSNPANSGYVAAFAF